jgi:RNA binding exosome subunit
VLTIRISKGKAVKGVVQNLFKMMIPNEKQEVNLDFENLLDENGNFYVRLDKQEALKCKIKLATRDPIRIKMKAKMFRPTPNGVREIFKDLGM